MAERRKPSEQLVGNEWQIFGSGVGLKTEDLQNYQNLANSRLRVLRGICVGDSYFQATLSANGLNVSSNYDFEDELRFPPELDAINGEIVGMLPRRRPIAVRSSALDEHGGSGIYTTDFFVTTGNRQEDLARLSHAQRIVYSDFFTDRASLYREENRVGSQSGMSLLIQPVIGDEHNGHFFPTLSGVLTTVNGQPLLRIVVGLGTRAVDMEQAVVLKGKAIDASKAIKALSTLRKADAINLNSGELDSIPVEDWMLQAASLQQDKLVSLLQEWEKGYNAGSPYYMEFAIAQSERLPVIVQASPDEIKPAITELGMPRGVVICEGKDVVNTGNKAGRGILWFGKDGQNPKDLAFIEKFNKDNHNFVLLVRDTAFSRVAGQPLIEMQHFSNAAGVVEIQYQRDEFRMPGMLNFTVDHTQSRGGAHFAEICKRKDILFLGHTMSKTGDELEQLLGRPTDRLGSFSAYWDVDFLMSNALSGGRVELLGEVARPEYSPGEISGWADEFWHLASHLGDGENGSLSAAFYGVTYLLADQSNGASVGYNPFDVSKLSTDEKERAGAIADLQTVIENLDVTESATEYEMYRDWKKEDTGEDPEFRLKDYLEKLLAVLLVQN